MQKFFTTTLVSKFIKYLLMSTPLPNCSFIEDGGIMVEGNYYVYHGRIYRCTLTGIFMGSHKYHMGHLLCSETVFCGENVFVTDKLLKYNGSRLAEYDIVSLYKEGSVMPGVTEDFMSTKGYYDADTHRKLGDYLRLIKSMYDLDLMSLYNCFCNLYVDNVDISSGKLLEARNPKYKVTLVPVKFNRTYTVALNSASPVYIKPVLYDGKLIRNASGDFVYDNAYTQIQKMGESAFSRPFNVSVWNTDSEAQALGKRLYLAIQIPVNNITPIAVLEGEFKNYNSNNIYDGAMFKYSIEPFVNKLFVSKCSLLKVGSPLSPSSDSLPFSERLIEYLVQHTIDRRESIVENVERVTDTFGYHLGHDGVWSSELRCKLFDAYMKLKDIRDEFCYEDILGYVDKDIEDALNKGVLRYVG